MNFDMTDDQLAFADAAKQFALQELAPHAAKWDREHIFPKQVIQKAGELGFCSLYSPESEGGMGLSRLDSSIIFEQLAMGCTTTTAMMTIHNMATWMVATWGTRVAKDKWCPSLVTGEKLASYCLTEPGSGSDAAAMRTSAKKDGEDYLLNGSKMFISGS
jgi:alkylation response protein AidB-like acyl-CoA dehydrogenase